MNARNTRRPLEPPQGRGREDPDLRFEFALIVSLIAIGVALAFLFMGDTISDLISLIGGTVAEATPRT